MGEGPLGEPQSSGECTRGSTPEVMHPLSLPSALFPLADHATPQNKLLPERQLHPPLTRPFKVQVQVFSSV